MLYLLWSCPGEGEVSASSWVILDMKKISFHSHVELGVTKTMFPTSLYAGLKYPQSLPDRFLVRKGMTHTVHLALWVPES